MHYAVFVEHPILKRVGMVKCTRILRISSKAFGSRDDNYLFIGSGNGDWYLSANFMGINALEVIKYPPRTYISYMLNINVIKMLLK